MASLVQAWRRFFGGDTGVQQSLLDQAAVAGFSFSDLVSALSGGGLTPTDTISAVSNAGGGRWVGFANQSNPTGGPYVKGDWVIDVGDAVIRICGSSGSPGAWDVIAKINASSQPSPLGATSAVGNISTRAARADHVHAYDPLWYSGGHTLASGEELLDRRICPNGISLSSGRLDLTFFTARKTEAINNVRTFVSGTAAAATPTLCRMGIYQVDLDANEAITNMTLLAATANDTTTWNSTFSTVVRPLTSTFSKVKGQRYAVGLLIVTASTAPHIVASVSGNSVILGSYNPRMASSAGGYSDLPASIAPGALGNPAALFQAFLEP